MAVLNTRARKVDLINYTQAVDKQEFINCYINENKEYGVTEANHVYSLLLIRAITRNDLPVVKDILSVDRCNILTTVESTKYSTFSTMLYHSDREIRKVINLYIAEYIAPYPELRTDCHPDDEAHILAVMRCFQFEYLTKAKYVKLLESLYLDITPFVKYLDMLARDCGCGY